MPEDHPFGNKAQQQPPLCAVWPSCRRSLGVHRWRSHAACEAETRRSGAASRFGQLRWLARQACVFCGTSELSPVQLLRKRHSSPRTSRWGHFPRQTTARATGRSGTAAGQQLPQGSQPVPPGEPLDGSSLLNCHFRDVVLTDRDKQLLIELRRASAMALPRCVVLSMGRKSRRSHERSPVLGTASAASVVACSLLKSRKVSTGTPS